MDLYINILSFLWAFFVAIFAIPSIIFVAQARHLFDIPNLRTVHQRLVPRLGGLAIFAGFVSSLTIFGDLDSGIKQMLAGAILVFFIGLKDDIIPVSAFKKFFVQVLATGIVMYIGEVKIASLYGILDVYTLSASISYPLTFLVIIGITNAVNLMDGVDGLAGVVILFICFFLGFCFFFWGDSNFQPYSTVCFALMGAIAGFLRFNLHKAVIFMGDTGSLVSGFIIAILAIKFVEMNPFPYTPVLVLAVLLVPIIDTIRVFLLRILMGLSPFSPDRNHLHHRLVDLGINQIFTVVILFFINLAAICLVLFFKDESNNFITILLGIYSITFITIIELLYRRKVGRTDDI